MRILFLHATTNALTSEYKIHATLAMNADREKLDPYFIWQSPIEINQIKIVSHDFGRNMSLKPKPGHYQRASMMLAKLPQTLAFLSSSIRQFQPDLIYTSQQDFDVRLAQVMGRYYRIPHVIHLHYVVGPWLGKYTLNVIRKSPRLIAVSEFTRQTALLQGVPSSNIHTVLNPSAFLQPQPNQEPRKIRREFKFNDDTPVILAVGRLVPGKGHLALINAFAKVIQHLPDARLLICGSSTTRDNYEAILRQRVAELNLNACVIFAGQRNDIPAILRDANVFCLPMELDSCPLVLLEAMTECKPIVAYYSGGVPEVVVHNQTGLLSYPSDIPALATNLLKVLSDPGYAQRLGEAGKLRVSTEFAPSRIAERWLNVLQEMVE